MKDKEELIKRFGEGLRKVDGLLEFLASQTNGIEDVQVSPEHQVAVYALDKHWWASGSGGIGMAAVIGVYRDGQTKSESFTYRDQYDPKRDNWNLYFNKVKIVEVAAEKIVIKAISLQASCEKNSRQLTFYLEGKPMVAVKKPRITKKEKESFESRVKEEMARIKKSHQHNHPLFTRQTQVREHVINHELKIAAFVLFEQIDTDRCTLEGSGWLGDQYRYSIWLIKDEAKASQLCEDHAYTKQRGCDIRGLRIFDEKIFATDYRGEEIEIKIIV